MLTFLVDLGFYEPARTQPTPVIVAWVTLEAWAAVHTGQRAGDPGVNAVANVWYRLVKKKP